MSKIKTIFTGTSVRIQRLGFQEIRSLIIWVKKTNVSLAKMPFYKFVKLQRIY